MAVVRNPGRMLAAGRLFALLSGPAIVGLISMAIASVTPQIAREIGGGDATLRAQMLMVLPAVMVLLGAPLGGWLADRRGHRDVLLVALVVYAISGASGFLIDGFMPLMASRLVLGLAGGAIQPACLALIASYYDGVERERVLGFVVTASSILAITGLMLGGALADAFGWRSAFLLYLAGAVVFGVALRCIGAPPIHSTRAPSDVPGHARLIRLWPLYAIVVTLGVGMFVPAIQAPFLLEEKGMSGATQASLPAAACAAVATLVSAFYGFFRRGATARGLIAVAFFSMGFGALLAGYGMALSAVVIGCAAIGIGAGLVEPSMATTILARTPPTIHAQAMGLLIAALYAGQFLNPLLFAALRGGFGEAPAVPAFGATLLILGTALAFTAKPRFALST